MLKRKCIGLAACVVGLTMLAHENSRTFAQGQAPGGTQAPPGRGGGRATAPALDPTKPHRLDITDGTKARYKVQEQLAGISPDVTKTQAVSTLCN